MEILIWFIFLAISAAICYKLALKNKLNTNIALFAGFLVPILAPFAYMYIGSRLYKRVHNSPARSNALKRWSYIIGGVLLVLVGLSSLNDSRTMGDTVWYAIVIIGGGYLAYYGFINLRKGDDSTGNRE